MAVARQTAWRWPRNPNTPDPNDTAGIPTPKHQTQDIDKAMAVQEDKQRVDAGAQRGETAAQTAEAAAAAAAGGPRGAGPAGP